MKVLFYGDIHHGTMIGKVDKSGLDLRIQDTLKIEKDITDICLREGIKLVIFCGDRFKNRMPPVWLINLVDGCWLDRVRSGIRMIAICGNHDYLRIKDYKDSFSILWDEDEFDISIFRTPNSLSIEGRNFGFFPFGFDLPDDSFYDIIVFHDEIYGFRDSRGYYANGGLDLKRLRERCKFFVGGHIHSFEDFGDGIYVGAPYQIDRLDAGSERGVVILDLETFKFDFIELDVPKLLYLDISSDDDLKKVSTIDYKCYLSCSVDSDLEREAKSLILKNSNILYIFMAIKKKRGLYIEKIFKNAFYTDKIEDAISEFVSSKDVFDKKLVLDTGLRLWRGLDDSIKVN